MLIELNSVYKEYIRGEKRFYAVQNINLSVDNGGLISIIGYSGSGKSTLLSIAAGLLKPDKGQVLLNNINIVELKDKELARLRNNDIGYIPQGQSLLSNLTVLDNILLPYRLYSKDNTAEEYAEELLSRLGIEELNNAYPDSLSGGEKKRAAVARALINKPKLLLADEPTADLDENNTKIIFELFKNISSSGTAVVTVTHELETLQYSTDVYEMSKGTLKQH